MATTEDFGLFFLMLSGSTLLRHLAQFYCAIYSEQNKPQLPAFIIDGGVNCRWIFRIEG